jgi:PE-PPE domain-containing protein
VPTAPIDRAVGVAVAFAAAYFSMSVAEAHADPDAGADFLDGSTHAIVMSPTFIPDPTTFPGYVPGAVTEYLQPLGFSDTGTITPLVTEESPNFGPSIASGVDTLVHAIEADYSADGFSAADPLTVFGYSQSAVIASLAEQELATYGIPLDDLRFVMLGDAAADPPSGPTGLLDTWGATPFGQAVDQFLGWSNLDDVTTPNDLYPTDVFTIGNDLFADTATPADFAADPLGALWQDFVGFFDHGVYLGGLPESEILAAIDGGGVADGATTYFSLADPVNLLEALWDTTLGSFGVAVP